MFKVPRLVPATVLATTAVFGLALAPAPAMPVTITFETAPATDASRDYLILAVGNDVIVALSGATKAASGPVFVVVGMTFALYPLVDIGG